MHIMHNTSFMHCPSYRENMGQVHDATIVTTQWVHSLYFRHEFEGILINRFQCEMNHKLLSILWVFTVDWIVSFLKRLRSSYGMKGTSLLKESIWSVKVVFVGPYCRHYVFGSNIVIKRVSIITLVWYFWMKKKYEHNV